MSAEKMSKSVDGLATGGATHSSAISWLDRYRFTLGDAITYLHRRGFEAEAHGYQDILGTVPPAVELTSAAYRTQIGRCACALLHCLALARQRGLIELEQMLLTTAGDTSWCGRHPLRT
jgi:hypothetical protein